MIFVSVIIPVYNSEKFLKDCIDSLLTQTLLNCEFIFVNDGSIDSSKAIVESYSKIDNRIHLINQENQGVSVARNNGLKIAQGEYVGFVDADDYVQSDFFERLYTTAIENKVKIVTSNFISELDHVITYNRPLFQTDKIFFSDEIKSHIVPFFIEKDEMNTACNKLYSSELIKENNIYFPSGVANGEDGLFNIQAFYKSRTVLFIDYNGYFYREVSDSATRNIIKNDYFKFALEKYKIDYKKQFGIELINEDVDFLKAKRLINSIISLIHIYLNVNNKLSFVFKYEYVKNMISNQDVQTIIEKYWQDFYPSQPKYHQYILYCIKIKSFLGLYLAIKYSNFRNKK